VFLRAFSLGGGTYTGIEAAATACRSCASRASRPARRPTHMATSLAITAGELAYMLLVSIEEGRTLHGITEQWKPWGLPIGIARKPRCSRGRAVVVAAQTGFIDGLARSAMGGSVRRSASPIFRAAGGTERR
jgi:hypothetical protein